MTAEMWLIIGTGLGMVGAVGYFFRILNTRIADLNTRIDDVRTDMGNMEARLNTKIDSVEQRLNARIDEVNGRIDEAEQRLNGRMERMESRLTVRMDAHDHRFDIVDERLRAVEQGNAEVIGAVNMMQTIVVETLNREIDSERAAAVGAD